MMWAWVAKAGKFVAKWAPTAFSLWMDARAAKKASKDAQ